MDKAGLGKRIGIVRRENRLTAEKLSELCDVQPITIRQIEGGSRLPSLALLVKICNALHVSANYLLADSLESNETDSLDLLSVHIAKLTPRQIEKVKNIAVAVINTIDS